MVGNGVCPHSTTYLLYFSCAKLLKKKGTAKYQRKIGQIGAKIEKEWKFGKASFLLYLCSLKRRDGHSTAPQKNIQPTKQPTMAEPDEIEIEITENEENPTPPDSGSTPTPPDAPNRMQDQQERLKRWGLRWQARLSEKTVYNKICWGALVIAVLTLLFVSDHSVWKMTKRRHTIRQVEAQTERYKERTQEIEIGLETLQSTDSLEKYAREKYYMHAPNEDVYLIQEK